MKGIEQFDFDVTLIFAVLNGRVSAAINRRLVMDFNEKGIDISPEQLTVLSLLWKKDRVTQQELCNITFKDKPNMTRLIDSLEKKGLAKRITDENDKRNNLILLTPEGKAIEEKAFLVANATMREALVNVTPQELAIGQDLLKKIFNNMQGKPNKEA
ncbi:MAG: MarR family transcriptional regulator [Bacteroidaceae bacterium]|jgi:DNA-binding MarR family transcriptional regulator|nr:MarR family transcriptional regulator [Bacteroidaceae bacterium]MBP3833933.1 MarR family transcriptional regulator [Bacteroidaceae bacterium]MBQ9675144.1 MarR family transcriptional regulator [Bacteroidaceae bacterium]